VFQIWHRADSRKARTAFGLNLGRRWCIELKHAEMMRKNPDMEHDDANGKRLAPKQTDQIVWKFSKAGDFEYSCLIPGHREAGMTGTIVVK